MVSGRTLLFRNIRAWSLGPDDTEKIDVAVALAEDAVTFTPKKAGRTAIVVPYESITSMTYDRRSRVRKLFVGGSGNWGGKAEDHFLTIQYAVGGVGDFVEIEMGKDAAPRVLATLEAKSGKKIERAGSGG